MSVWFRVAARLSGGASIGKWGLVCLIVGAGTLAQGCSASRETGDGSGSWRLGGNDKPAVAAKPPEREQWQQPAAFDADAPPAPVYRGGRDPMTGRAQTWPPASTAPTPVASAPLTPLPAATTPRYDLPPAAAPYARQAAAPIAAQAAPAAAGGAVEVRKGDTLYRIAKAHNVTVPSLMQANGLSSESIKVGQRIVIPAR